MDDPQEQEYYRATLTALECGEFRLTVWADFGAGHAPHYFDAQYDFDYPFMCELIGLEVTCCGQTDGSVDCPVHKTTVEDMLNHANDLLWEISHGEAFQIPFDALDERWLLFCPLEDAHKSLV